MDSSSVEAIGDGVRELEEALDGEEERERSAEPGGEDARESVDFEGRLRLLPRVVIIPSPFLFGRGGTAAMCFGARGGLFSCG